MPDQVYDNFRELLATGQFNWVADDVDAYLIDMNQYTFDIQHQFLSSVPVGARVAVATLTGKTATRGACMADTPTTFSLVNGPTIQAVLLVKNVSNDPSMSPLIVLIMSYSNLSNVTPNGGNIYVHWPSGDSNKIFRV